MIDPRITALRDSLAGQVLRGSGAARYHLRECIGEGGQGWVFKANWEDPSGFLVIVKVLRPDAVNAETLARFQREAEVLRLLTHQARPNVHIVRFFDHAVADFAATGGHGEPLRLPFTVLEYVSGPTLEQVLQRASGQGMAVDRTRRLLRQVAQALDVVHAHKIVHRDLKPSNILLAHESGAETAKVTDFGLVKVVEVNLQRTTALAGASLGYAPPEQYEQGNQRVTPRTDVFSLAAIAFEMLAGRPAFPYKERENPLLIVTRVLNGPRPALARARDTLAPELRSRPDLIEKLDVQLARATSADPQDRHESAAEFMNAIEPLLRATGEPRPSQTIEPQPKSGHGPDFSTIPIASVGMPRISETMSSNPSAWRWRVLIAPLRPGAIHAVAFAHGGDAALAVGPTGLVRWDARGWTTLPTPAGLTTRTLRGVTWLRSGDVLVYGESGLAVRLSASGAHELLPIPHRDVTFLGAHEGEAGTLTLVGERPARRPGSAYPTVGTLVQVAEGRLQLMSDAVACARLRGVTKLHRGPLVACGDWGALVRLELGVAEHVAALCGGHLFAIEATSDGGAVTVGGGGHALSLSPRLEAQLEAVQTTRDLVSLAYADDGVAWAGAAQARLLRRTAGSWVRMSGEVGVTGQVLGVWGNMHMVRAICDDGAVIAGSVS